MSLIKISPEEAKNYIPLKENYGNKGVEYAKYFTLTPANHNIINPLEAINIAVPKSG